MLFEPRWGDCYGVGILELILKFGNFCVCVTINRIKGILLYYFNGVDSFGLFFCEKKLLIEVELNIFSYFSPILIFDPYIILRKK